MAADPVVRFRKREVIPCDINQTAQDIVRDILTNPGSTTTSRHHARLGEVTEIRAPDGRGVRFDANGNFIGFLRTMAKQLTSTIASVPDRDEGVVELWCGSEQWGEIAQEGDDLRLEIYPNPTGKPWAFEFDEVVEFLKRARCRLLRAPVEEG